MGKVTINDDTLTSIANAIRVKNGKTNKYKPSEMPAEIRAIDVGNIATGTVDSAFLDGTALECENNDIRYLRDYAFWNHTGLKKVRFNNVAEMGQSAFKGCVNLEDVHIFALTDLPPYAFDGLSKLKEIYMPNVKRINSGCFRNCTSLESVEFLSLEVGAGMGAFENCNSLRYVDFGQGQGMFSCFRNCSALETLILRFNGVVEMSSYPFMDSSIDAGTGYIYVPSSLVDDYIADANWSAYANQIRAIEDYPDICG